MKIHQKDFEYILDMLLLLSKFTFSVKTYWEFYRIIKNIYLFGVKV